MNYENLSNQTFSGIFTGVGNRVATWVAAGTNLWKYTYPDTRAHITDYVALEDDLTQMFVRSPTPGIGQWDRVNAKDGKPATVTFGSVLKPEGIIVGTSRDPCMYLKNCNDCVIELEAAFASCAVITENCTNIDIYVRMHHVGVGVQVIGGSSIQVLNIDADHIGKHAVYVTGTVDKIRVTGGAIDKPGMSESTAGIYLGSCVGDVVVEGVLVSQAVGGNYWPYDGGGFHADNGTSGAQFFDNIAVRCPVGLKDNSGSPGQVFRGNSVIECPKPWRQVDSELIGKADTVWDANKFINCPVMTYPPGSIVI